MAVNSLWSGEPKTSKELKADRKKRMAKAMAAESPIQKDPHRLKVEDTGNRSATEVLYHVESLVKVPVAAIQTPLWSVTIKLASHLPGCGYSIWAPGTCCEVTMYDPKMAATKVMRQLLRIAPIGTVVHHDWPSSKDNVLGVTYNWWIYNTEVPKIVSLLHGCGHLTCQALVDLLVETFEYAPHSR